MPRGGVRPNAGRKSGIPNKATIERREQARIDAENAAAAAASDAAKAATVSRKKLAKDVLEEFMLRFGDMAAYHQPARTWHQEKRGRRVVRVNDNPNMDEDKFRAYAVQAMQAARDLAPYQSPRLSTVAVGQATRKEVVVIGGLPPRKIGPPIPAPPAIQSGVAGPAGVRRSTGFSGNVLGTGLRGRMDSHNKVASRRPWPLFAARDSAGRETSIGQPQTNHRRAAPLQRAHSPQGGSSARKDRHGDRSTCEHLGDIPHISPAWRTDFSPSDRARSGAKPRESQAPRSA
jgi:hypothetical protein